MVVLFYDLLIAISVTTQATHTRRYNRASSPSVLLAFMAASLLVPTEVSGEISWASATTDKPSCLPGHDGMAHGTSVGRQADAFPPPLCPFSYLPDGGPIQAGIPHPIDNVASVSCRSSTL